MSINYELYKVFYYVAKNLSFSRASKILYISQSAVSQNIHQLEEKLQTQLFIRTTKQVTLTKAGQQLLNHVEPAIHMLISGEVQLQQEKSLSRGQLHIAASDTICRYYLLPFFQLFHEQYPNIEIKVTNRTSIRCVDLLEQGSVDLIVTNLPNKHIGKDMTAVPTTEFQDIFICHENREIDNSTPLKLIDLNNHPILMLTKSTTTSEFLRDLFMEENLTLAPSIELGSIDLLVDMTRIDLGVSFVPEFCVKPLGNLRVLTTQKNIPKRSIGYISHNKRPQTDAAKAFIKLLEASVKK